MQIPEPQKKTGRKPASLRLWRLGQKRVPFYGLLIVCLAVLIMGWILSENYNRDIARLMAQIDAANEQVFAKERENLKLSEKVRLAASDSFIANEARTQYGYIFPGEIRFVVTNPEVLGLPPPPARHEGDCSPLRRHHDWLQLHPDADGGPGRPAFKPCVRPPGNPAVPVFGPSKPLSPAGHSNRLPGCGRPI